MPFEGFLADTRARPRAVSVIGFLASLSLHGPPVTAFIVAWLTQTLVLGGGYFDLTDREAIVYYEVPIAMMAAFPSSYGQSRTGGSGQGTGAKASDGDGGSPKAHPAGKRGQRGRGRMGRGRRRIVRPHVTRSSPVTLTRKVALGHGDSEDGLGAGLGRGNHGGVDKDGAGTARGGQGSGGGGLSGGGEGSGVPYLAAAGLPLAEKKPGRKLEKKSLGEEVDPAGFGKDDEAVVGTPLPGRPERVSMDYAAYLRVYDTFPSLPESFWPGGVRTLTMLVEVCVDNEGSVSDVVFRKSAGPDTDAYLRPAIFAWRYRPRVIRGFSTAFCHPILIEYKRELFGRSW